MDEVVEVSHDKYESVRNDGNDEQMCRVRRCLDERSFEVDGGCSDSCVRFGEVRKQWTCCERSGGQDDGVERYGIHVK